MICGSVFSWLSPGTALILATGPSRILAGALHLKGEMKRQPEASSKRFPSLSSSADMAPPLFSSCTPAVSRCLVLQPPRPAPPRPAAQLSPAINQQPWPKGHPWPSTKLEPCLHPSSSFPLPLGWPLVPLCRDTGAHSMVQLFIHPSRRRDGSNSPRYTPRPTQNSDNFGVSLTALTMFAGDTQNKPAEKGPPQTTPLHADGNSFSAASGAPICTLPDQQAPSQAALIGCDGVSLSEWPIALFLGHGLVAGTLYQI